MTEASNSSPLAEWRVLLTRPAEKLSDLAELVAGYAAETQSMPMLAIEPLSQAASPDYEISRQRILNIDLYHVVIFISANAAQYGIDLIDEYWPQLPIGINWFAIGKSTAHTLADYGIGATHSEMGYDSESLLSHPSLQSFENERVLIVRGQGGRETLKETLESRGAQVDYAELYKRCCPSYSDEEVFLNLYSKPLNAIFVSSGETLDNLLATAAGSKRQFNLQPVLDSHLIVPSERIAERAKAAGFAKVSVAAGPDDPSMVRALLRINEAEVDK